MLKSPKKKMFAVGCNKSALSILLETVSITVQHWEEGERIYNRDTTNFDKENFILDVMSTDWNSIISLEKEDPNLSVNNFLTP